MCFDFLYNFLPEIFLILGRNEGDMLKNVYWSASKIPVIIALF
jgi:hypothetical protein